MMLTRSNFLNAFRRSLLALILLSASLILHAQTDSVSKNAVSKKALRSHDTSRAKKQITNSNTNNHPINKKIKTGQKVKVKDTSIYVGGIGNTGTFISTRHDSIQKLKDTVAIVISENSELKNRIEVLQAEKENLKNQLKSQQEQNDNGGNKIKSFSKFKSLFTLILTFFIIVFGLLLIYKVRNSKINYVMQGNQKLKPQTLNAKPQNQPVKSTPNNIVSTGTSINKNLNPVKSFSNIYQNDSSNNEKWFIVGASAIGKSHISNDRPCQDNHFCGNIGYGWGIAITCDGAGSAENSDIGSEFVSKKAFEIFKDIVLQNKFHKKNILPTDEEWGIITNKAFNQIYLELEGFAKLKNIETVSVACTIIVVVYSPDALLVAHLGDGRAGYCNEKGYWDSMITPHKGEEANQTIFISSIGWQNSNDFTMSGVSVPESRVIREKPIAFTLMSDGCETHSFECSKMDSLTTKWQDPNIPFPKFFDPLVANLKVMHRNNVSLDDANLKWRKFVEEGTPGLRDESDDKTLILGILI